MTFYGLEQALIAEVTDILKDMVFTGPDGEDTAGVKGYEQDLPLAVGSEDSLKSFMPYFIVRITDGKAVDDESCWTVYADILFGVFDDYLERGIREEVPEDEWQFSPQGHKQILSMIQRVSDRFVSEPLLDHRYMALSDMEFAVETDDTYPYAFGGLRIGFMTPKMGRKEII